VCRKVIIFFIIFKSFLVFPCEEKERVCTKKQGSFEVDGETVKRDCVEYSYVIDCPVKIDTPCTRLKNKPCTLIESDCGAFVKRGESSFCNLYNNTYACEEEIVYEQEKWRLVMGDKPIEPSCYRDVIPDFKDSLEDNADFQNAAAGLHSLKDGVHELKKEQKKNGLADWHEAYAKDTEVSKENKIPKEDDKKAEEKTNKNYTVSLFKGEARECKKNILGTRNCCREDEQGWAVSLSLATPCRPEEENFAKLKRGKKCVFLGSYCFEEKLGICLDKRESACCFESVLAKTLNTEGKKQLGKSFGSAKNPDCSGLNVQEIKKVDFKKADFTEFFEVSVVPNLKVPSKDAMLKGVESGFSRIKESTGERGTLKEEKTKAHTNKRLTPKGVDPKYKTKDEKSKKAYDYDTGL
jgi:hypothetical protein